MGDENKPQGQNPKSQGPQQDVNLSAPQKKSDSSGETTATKQKQGH